MKERILLLAVGFFWTGVVGADDKTDARARAALALARARAVPVKKACDCAETGQCDCGPDCPCPGCFDNAFRKGIKENKPILIFVGQKTKRLDGCVDCYVKKFKGDDGKRVVIGIPDGDGLFDMVANIKGEPTAAKIKKVLEAAQSPAAAVPVPSQSYYYQPAPQYFAPAPSFGGGFGGGGGCAGGRCRG